MIVSNEVSTGETLASQFADFVPGIEYRLQGVVDVSRKVACVGAISETEMALSARDNARLGKGRSDRHVTRTACRGSREPTTVVHIRK